MYNIRVLPAIEAIVHSHGTAVKYNKFTFLLLFAAVKCNSDLAILRTLADRDINFDCATKREIELVLSLGVSPSRIVYAHTIKNPSYIRYAKYNRVTRMTFDNTAELIKVSL